MARTQAARDRSPAALGRWDPFLPLFRLLTSVRFALWLIGFLAVGALLGVVFPQMPEFVRESEAQRQQWLATEAARYGALAGPMERLQLFEVFKSYWFNAGLLVLLVSVSVCTVNRFPPIWRSIRRPPRRVNEQYFQRAHHRAAFTTPPDPDALVRVLRKQRYKVEETVQDGVRYLYADRFSWAQLGTFASHLALLIFLAGGLVTWRLGYREDVLIAEGTTRPVLDVRSPDHMQVEVLNFIRRTDGQGRDLEYRTELVVYQDGREVARGSSTVNDPFQYNGYTFHQAAFSEDGAALTVREAATGRALYDEVIEVFDRLPAPRLVVRDAAGAVVYDGFLAPTSFPAERVAAATLTIPNTDRTFWVATRQDAPAEGEQPAGPPFTLGVVGPGGGFHQLRFGESAAVDGYTVTFASMGATKARVLDRLPGVTEEQVLVQTLEDAGGAASMILLLPDREPLVLPAGQPATVDGVTYEFGGPRAFSGITVRKDPGASFIWVATALMMVGLGMTFYLPRRRLWAKITPDRTYLAGIADRTAKFGEELRRIGAEAGSPDALEPEPPAGAAGARGAGESKEGRA
ncbi:MAG TPA: cytochrome c biogenesis protein ResB [Dehalococcoidia bacterium]